MYGCVPRLLYFNGIKSIVLCNVYQMRLYFISIRLSFVCFGNVDDILSVGEGVVYNVFSN